MSNVDNSRPSCSVEGCDLAATRKNLCEKHHKRWVRHGDPLAGAKSRNTSKRMKCGHRQCPAAKKICGHLDYLKNADTVKARALSRYYLDVEASRQVAREYAALHRQEAIARSKTWKVDNPERYRANNARNLAQYRAHLRQATPPWVDQGEIDKVYMTAPRGFHVDHIIPIRGENVCGLHVHWNLRHLPDKENLSKSNKLDEDLGIDLSAPAWN